MKKDTANKSKHKKTGIGTLMLDKIKFKGRSITRDKKGCFIMIKGSI